MGWVSQDPPVPWGRVLPFPISGGLAFPFAGGQSHFRKGRLLLGLSSKVVVGPGPSSSNQGVGSLTSSLLVLPSLPLQPSHPRAPALFLPWAFSAGPSPPLGALSLTSSQNPRQSLLRAGAYPSAVCKALCVRVGAGGMWEAKPSISRARLGLAPRWWRAPPGLTWRRG